MIDVLDNINDYKITYKFVKDYKSKIKSINNVDCLFYYGMLKQKDCNVFFLYPLYSKQSITVRILIFGLMDYKELSHKNEFGMREFISWFNNKGNYKRYLIIVWIIHKLKTKKYNTFIFNELNPNFEEQIKEFKKSNINNMLDDMEFDIEKLNLDDFKKSKIKNHNITLYLIKSSLLILVSSNIINVYDKLSNNKKIKMTEDSLTRQVINLNKTFSKIENRFKKDNWLF